MQLVQTADLLPHTCCVCLEGKGPFLDTLVDQLHGRLYICRGCGLRAARHLGALIPLRAALAEERGHIRHLQARIEELETEAEESARAVALTLAHGAVTKSGTIVPRKRAPRKTTK